MTKKELIEEDLRMAVSHKKDLLSYYKNLVKHYEEHLEDTRNYVKKTEKELATAENTYREFVKVNTRQEVEDD